MTSPQRRAQTAWIAVALALAAAAMVAVAVLGASGDHNAARAAAGAPGTPGRASVPAPVSRGSARDGSEGASGTSAGDAGVLAPLPTARPKVVEPVAGQDVADARRPAAGADDTSLPKPTGPATVSAPRRGRDGGVRGLTATRATALPNGVALPPLEAPEPVLDVIRAGNIIARTPYKWGGGHGRFQDSGYDCSGSVSYALYFAGLIDGPHTSGDLMRYGRPGNGRWITLYASGGHVYMEVAGIRFDTSGARVTGSRWQNELRGRGPGFAVRHPPGL